MHVNEVIVVEGIYDQKKLSTLLDAIIVPTYGFSVFTDDARLKYLYSLAEKRGLILLLDADFAGQKIRKFLEEKMPPGTVKNAYIPGIEGKEKRKKKPSAAGFLGVEGVSDDIILSAIQKAASFSASPKAPITMQDFYAAGLSGRPDSRARREALASHIGAPPQLSAKALLSAANALISRKEWEALISVLF